MASVPRRWLYIWRGLFAALAYGGVSLSITLFNKAVFSWYQFNFSATLTLAQMIFSIILLLSMRKIGLIDFPDPDLPTCSKLLPLACFFVWMVMSGLTALRYVNVPMYGALRRATTWLVMLGEQFILSKTYPKDEAISVHLMIIGALIASIGDLSFDPKGYLLTAGNCIVTSLYLVYIPKKEREVHLNSWGLLFYNNLLSIPMVIFPVVLWEWPSLRAYPFWTDPGFQFTFLASAVQALLLNYTMFLCSTVNSPLATSITGQLKNLLQTLVGLFMFGDVTPTPLLNIGLAVSSFASSWYGYIKYQQTVQNAARKQQAKD